MHSELSEDIIDEPLAPEQFRDSAGRLYTLELSVGLGRRIKQQHGVDLVNVVDGKAFQRLADREVLLEVLWDFVEATSLEVHSIDRDEFENALDGSAMAAAGDALVAAILNFSPPKLRPGLEAVVKASDAATTAAMQRMVTSIQSGPLKKRLDEGVNAMLQAAEQDLSTSGTSATSSPLSAAVRRKATP
jgi:hypothetical protein